MAGKYEPEFPYLLIYFSGNYLDFSRAALSCRVKKR